MKPTLTTSLALQVQPIHISIAGSGFIGVAHTRSARLSGAFTLTAAAPSRDLIKGVPIAASLGVIADRVYAGGEALIRDGGHLFSAVIIATPNKSHRQLAVQALQAGLHVICDKPLAASHEDAIAMSAAADAAPDLVNVCTFQNTGNPMLHLARYLFDQGEVSDDTGVPVTAQGTYFQGWLVKPRQPGEGGFQQEAWRVDPEQSGEAGGLADIGGSHVFNALNFVTGGLWNTGKVGAHLFIDVEGRLVDDNGVMIAFGKNGARATIQHSQTMLGKKNDLTFSVAGNKGRIEFDSATPEQLILTRANGETIVFYKGVNMPDCVAPLCHMPPAHPEGYADWMENIYRLAAAAIYEKTTGEWPTNFIPKLPFPTFRDGLYSNAFIHGSVISSKARGALTDY